MPTIYGGEIREEVGNAKFCILVDEAVDESHKEQMAIILKFVDCDGVVREHSLKPFMLKKIQLQLSKQKFVNLLLDIIFKLRI